MTQFKDEIIFNNVTYKLMSKGNYYLSQSTHNAERRKAKSLHVAIWEYHNNKSVPKGYVIHHIDGNKFNNDISNLQCLTREEHYNLHRSNMLKANKSKEHIEHLNNIRHKATEWHKSEAGKEWHKQHGAKLKKQYPTRICQYCGKEYQSKNLQFCSRTCSNKSRSIKN